VVGLVDPDTLKPGDLVGVNKDSYLILDTLPSEYDSRVKAMEVDEKPTEEYSDIGGLDKQVSNAVRVQENLAIELNCGCHSWLSFQPAYVTSDFVLSQQIQELMEAIVLPMTHKEQFDNLGIRPPKGVLLYGPPGTGKTLMARACAAQTNATYLKLAGPQLVQVISCFFFSVLCPSVVRVQLHTVGPFRRVCFETVALTGTDVYRGWSKAGAGCFSAGQGEGSLHYLH